MSPPKRDSAQRFELLLNVRQDPHEPVFQEPWQAQAFAMALALQSRGVFAWSEWAKMLGDRYRVIVQTAWDGKSADAMIALHARRSAASIRAFRAQAPDRGLAVVLTGIMGAIIVTPLMNRTGITDFRARGFAVGIAAHGIGTARAFQVDAVAGVFAGIAMSLNALLTSLLVPLAVTLLVR